MGFTVEITWATVNWIGLVLAIISVIALIQGSLPDNERRPRWDTVRWISWPLLAMWIIAQVIKGVFS